VPRRSGARRARSAGFQGRLDEAIAEGKRAAELNPLSPQIPIDNSLALMFQGSYEAAKEQPRRAAELDSTFFYPVVSIPAPRWGRDVAKPTSRP
jgi:tetratricopeptide (TPR) repeat protein